LRNLKAWENKKSNTKRSKKYLEIMKLVRTQCAGINNSGSMVLMHGDEIESVFTKIWGKIEKCNGGVEKYQAGIWPGHDPHAVGCQELGQILLTGLLGWMGVAGCYRVHRPFIWVMCQSEFLGPMILVKKAKGWW